jgi:hypothetical protein
LSGRNAAQAQAVVTNTTAAVVLPDNAGSIGVVGVGRPRPWSRGARSPSTWAATPPGQWDNLAAAFHQQFPDVQLHLVTDLSSKYQDARIDNQLATGRLVADAAILQTTQDFDRWKEQGDLLKYKPVGWDKVFTNAKDKDGYYTGVFYGAFSYLVNTKQLPTTASDFKATALLKPVIPTTTTPSSLATGRSSTSTRDVAPPTGLKALAS